ncbi:hypothetical protein [Vreelandella indica]|uniref:hypothetical protein n=1 Tax=Vreelandella indica TaxID=3126500 RepID=UPI00300E2ED4|tara:strand:+ start:738 stop:1427 length:690 start_codon:yes stop_codon:yes gene_type:complete
MTLAEFEALASSKLEKNDEESREAFLRLLNDGLLVSIINNMMKSQSQLHEVANRSYWHKNGFLKVLLLDKRPKYSIRLHIWPDSPLQEGDVHNHPWNMSGLVLTGSYEWPIYTFEQVKEITKFALYKCRYLEDYSGYSFHRVGSVILKEVKNSIMQEGEFFQFPKEKYHSAKKENSDPADSIIITGTSESLTADVVSSREISCDKIMYNAPVKSSFLREKLSAFMGRNS